MFQKWEILGTSKFPNGMMTFINLQTPMGSISLDKTGRLFQETNGEGIKVPRAPYRFHWMDGWMDGWLSICSVFCRQWLAIEDEWNRVPRAKVAISEL
jgi:hypothetical protein